MRSVILIVMASMVAAGQTKEIAASVTYVAVGQVYVDAGRTAGVSDQATATVEREGRVFTSLRFLAASSRSSSWSADSLVATIRVGDRVHIVVSVADPNSVVDTIPPPATTSLLRSTYRRPDRPSNAPMVDLVGRVGPQVIVQDYDDRAQNFLQTGLILSGRARFRDLPLKVDLFVNARDVTRGGTRPWSARSANASRLYRALVEYDDGTLIASLGRSTLTSAPTLGVLDGLTVGRRWGDLTTGIGLGTQPDPALQGTDLTRRRFVLFSTIRPSEWASASAGVAYAKTWYHGVSEREHVNANGGVSITERLSIWTSFDLDLRVPRGGVHRWSPSLSLWLLTASWRLTDGITLNGGFDASRSVLPFSYARSIPDSMLDRSLRSGVTLSGSVQLPYGLSLTTNLTPRIEAGDFNGDYASSTSLSAYNVLGTGLGVRLQGLLSRSRVSSSHGYGLTASKQLWSIDWSLRAQQIRYRLTAPSSATNGTTLGLDAVIPLAGRLSWYVSADVVRGFGSPSRSLFSELTYRF